MHRVFVDANVLGSRTQYDWLFMLKDECYMYAVVTSEDVLDEAHRAWRRRYPSMAGGGRKRREDLFRRLFDEILDSWAGGEVPSLKDVHDTHVHNAAMAANVDILLTGNDKDFGDSADLPFDVYTPDDFFCLIAASSPKTVQNVTLHQANYWKQKHEKNPDGPRKRLDDALRDAGCPKFAQEVADHVIVLTGASPRPRDVRALPPRRA